MKLPTFIVCLLLGGCATLRDQAQFERLYAPEIKEFNRLIKP